VTHRLSAEHRVKAGDEVKVRPQLGVMRLNVFSGCEAPFPTERLAVLTDFPRTSRNDSYFLLAVRVRSISK
jgi:hypothetical protein